MRVRRPIPCAWLVVRAIVLCAGVAPAARAQYPYVPPPSRCIPLSEGPGILAGIAPSASNPIVPRDLAILRFTYEPLPSDSERALVELRDRLEARLRSVRPSSLRAYAGPAQLQGETVAQRNIELATLGEQIGARRLVAGRIEKDASGVHVVVDVYNVRTGARVWRTEKVAPLSNLLRMELELARDVAAYALGSLTSIERERLASTPTRDEVAYAHFVRGVISLRDSNATVEAVSEFRAATRQEPKFAEAWSKLAIAYAQASSTFLTDSTMHDSLAVLAMAAADEAGTLAPLAAHSWMARGVVMSMSEPPRPYDALAAFEQAVALEPTNAEAHRRLGRAMLQQSRAAESQMHLLRALTLQPEDAAPLVDLGELELNQHAFGQSCRALDLALSMNPRNAAAYLLRAMSRLGRGDVRHAWVDAETGRRLGSEIGGQAVAVLVDVAARDTAGATERVRELQRQMRARKNITVSDGGYVALGLAAIGDRIGAIELLERVRPRGPELYSFMHRPGFDWLWSEARFRRLLEVSNSSIGQ